MIRRFVPILGAVLGISLAIAACGGSGTSQEELDRARKQGAAQARRQEKIQQIEKQLRELKRGTPNGTGTASTPASTDVSPCGGDLYVGPNTTCGFAVNVRNDYFSQIGAGSGTVSSYSPTTERVYEMFCTAGEPHVCAGGNDASVYFP